jgi:hypothetical protein
MAQPNRPKETMHLGEKQTSYDIPPTGPIDKEAFMDAFEIVDGPTGMDKAETLSFMDEPVTIRILETSEPNASQICQLSVNGTNQFVIRGRSVTIKRKFVEVLARARTGIISTPEYTDSTGARATRIVKNSGLTYPFSVISDRNPKGAAWLEAILSEA